MDTDVNETYIRRSEEVQGVQKMFYVRSVYVLFKENNAKNECREKTNLL